MIINNPKVAIIILNWNGLKDTIECLESVKKIDYPNYEIIVVDNASVDGSPEKLKELFPDITLIRNKENLGYAGGNNVGIRYALKNNAEYIFVLNNDTVVVDKDILKILVKTANLYPDAGVFGPKICLYDEPNKIGFSPTYWDKRKCTFILKKYYDYDEVVEIDDIRGCAIFFKREVVEKIGLFDSKFFLK